VYCPHCAPAWQPGARFLERTFVRAFGEAGEEEDELLQIWGGGGPPEGSLGDQPVYRTVKTSLGPVMVVSPGYEPTVQGYLQAYDVVSVGAAENGQASWLTLVRRQDGAGNAPSFLPSNGASGVIVDADPTVFPPQIKMSLTRTLGEAVAGKSSFMPTGQPIIIGQPASGWRETGKMVGGTTDVGPVPGQIIEQTLDKVSSVASGIRVGTLIGAIVGVGGIILYDRRRGRR
jgi:hypothetical protein